MVVVIVTLIGIMATIIAFEVVLILHNFAACKLARVLLRLMLLIAYGSGFLVLLSLLDFFVPSIDGSIKMNAAIFWGGIMLFYLFKYYFPRQDST